MMPKRAQKNPSPAGWRGNGPYALVPVHPFGSLAILPTRSGQRDP